MEKKEIKNQLKKCFLKCAEGRRQLRKCVINAMNAGLSKQDILAVSDELADGSWQDEAPLCSITAIGQALQYEENQKRSSPINLTKNEKEEIKNKLKQCFKKCALARRQLRKFIVSSLDSGLTKEELLALTDEIVGGLGKNEVSICAIVAVDQVLRYEASHRAKPIDIVKERALERGDI
jgi:DNA-binding transcriptional regulator YhcF (GntR family)